MTGDGGIRWRTWDAEAFQEARSQDKPILLRLSAVWCHWCHVMDGTSDKDPRAIRLLNEAYVPIRVDIDKMPDVRERYNFGGFPTSAFLTPTGEILTGGTYIPPDRFVELLEAVSKAYRTRKQEILAQLEEHRGHRASHAPPPPAPGSLAEVGADLADTVVQSVRVNFDVEHGGFGTQPKFPHSPALELCLRLLGSPDGSALETVARRTLDAMRQGALWDREEKAFFRYSVTRDWSEPHYEKMLETNAGLLRNYALAAGALGKEEYAQVCREMRGYIEATLRDPGTGLFHGSQDADEEYYARPLAARRNQKAPFVDRTAYADWSAEMVEAYLEAYRSLGDASWLDEGLRGLGGLLGAVMPGKALHHFAAGGKPGGAAVLSDVAQLLRANLSAYELTGDPRHLERTDALVALSVGYWDDARGLFRDRAPSQSDLGLVSQPSHPLQENGLMARCLLRHAALRGEAVPKRVEAMLRSMAPLAERQGLFASDAAMAALEAGRAALELVVVAPTQAAQPFLQEAARVRHHPLRILRFDPRNASEAARRGGIGAIDAPAAFACAGSACSRLFRPGEAFARDVLRLLRA